MNYSEAIEWLYTRVANYQNVGGSAYKPGLDTVTALCEYYGNPQKRLKYIHIAGTNGKGSTAHCLSAALQENNYKVGLFSSPHLNDFRERIKINGEMIDEETVVDFVNWFRESELNIDPSFFELTTVMSFVAFEKAQVDYAIIECGLGGRLDATNIILPEVSVITSIGLEHTEYLGETIQEIAREKGGIIKEGVPVVFGELSAEADSELIAIASERNSLVHRVGQRSIQSDLAASYQQKNLNLAYTTLEAMNATIDFEKALQGFQKVGALSGLQGRFQKVAETPAVYMDGAHNVAGIQTLIGELELLEYEQLHVVFGGSSDKDIGEMLRCFPASASLYLSTFDSERSATKEQLENGIADLSAQSEVFADALKAKEAALSAASSNDLVLICGSFFLLAEYV